MRYSYATHLACSSTGQPHELSKLHGLSSANKPLLARYDLEALKHRVSRAEIASRAATLWRWHELLPVPDASYIVSLGEEQTPLIPLLNSRQPRGYAAPLVKDEGRLPTGSFKARGLCLAVSMAKFHRVRRVAIPTNGNAGAALAAYAARAGMEAFCFCPSDTPEINVREIAAQGAAVWRVNGLINDCAKLSPEGAATYAAYLQAAASDRIKPSDKVVLFNCATGLKYAMPDHAETMDVGAPLDAEAVRRKLRAH